MNTKKKKKFESILKDSAKIHFGFINNTNH